MSSGIWKKSAIACKPDEELNFGVVLENVMVDRINRANGGSWSGKVLLLLGNDLAQALLTFPDRAPWRQSKIATPRP